MEKCNRCGRTEERAIADNHKIGKGMLWNDDNQEWICQACDANRAVNSVIAAALNAA